MEPRRKPSFGALLLLAIATVSFALVYARARGLAAGRAYAERSADVHTQNLAQALEQSIAARFQRIDHALVTVIGALEGELASGRPDFSRVERVVKAQEKLLPEVVAIRITDATGAVILNNPSGRPQGHFRDRPFWETLRDQPGAGRFITKPILGTFTQQWVVTSARRYTLPDGRFGGVVVIPMLVERLQQALTGFELGEGGMLTLRDEHGAFVARHPEKVKGRTLAIGDPEISPELRNILDAGVDHRTYRATAPFDQTRRTLTFRRVPGTPLVVVASLAEEDYLSQWRRERTRSAWTLASVIGSFWILSGTLWWLWKRQQRSVDLLKKVTAMVPGMVYQYRLFPDLRSCFPYASEGITDIYEVTPEQVREDASPVFERIHPEDVEPTREAILASGRTLALFHWEFRVNLPRKGPRWLLCDARPERMPDGGTLWHGIITDITERKRTEASLLASEEKFATAFQVCPDAMTITRFSDGCYLAVNERFTTLTGYAAEEVIGRTSAPGDLGIWTRVEDRRAFLDALLQEGTIEGREFHFRRKDGTPFVALVSSRVFDLDGEPCAFSITHDITGRRQMEEERHRLQAELQQVQKMESLGSLAGGIAHDMNNVLGAVLGLASANLEGQAPGSPAHRAFETIIKAAERGGNMVKSLLNFARKAPAETRELDLNALLREEVHLLERTTLARIQLELALAEGLPSILGDAGALSHAFMNLCVNAVDAMPGGGTLTLRTRKLDTGWVEVDVADTGTGMPEDVLAQAMDPFFTTKEVGKGTGLGLSMVFSTVKTHGGEMDLQSDPSRGTCVRLRFPAVSPSNLDPSQGTPFRHAARPSALTVLVVDDDELVRGSTQALLEALGHRVALAGSGEEALAMLEGGAAVDLVILDLNMPGLGGAGTFPKVRALRPGLPVILATGRADQAAQHLVARHPPATLMAKPFSLADLAMHLDAFRPA